MADATNPVTERIDALMTIDDVADLMRMPVASLRYWRMLCTGPRGFIIGRRLRYLPADVLAWIAEQHDTDPSAA